MIAKKGMDRVFLQNPKLKTCSGRRAPRTVRFAHMYGPKFGTLLPHGTHIILGRITYKNEVSINFFVSYILGSYLGFLINLTLL